MVKISLNKSLKHQKKRKVLEYGRCSTSFLRWQIILFLRHSLLNCHYIKAECALTNSTDFFFVNSKSKHFLMPSLRLCALRPRNSVNMRLKLSASLCMASVLYSRDSGPARYASVYAVYATRWQSRHSSVGYCARLFAAFWYVRRVHWILFTKVLLSWACTQRVTPTFLPPGSPFLRCQDKWCGQCCN